MSSKFNFTIKDVDHATIIERYSLYIDTNDEKIQVTKLSDIEENKKTPVSFLDDIKNSKKYVVTMIDLIKKEKIPEKTDIFCFWCRSSFDTIPIGCPIRYVPSQYEKKYFSEITKDKYVIRHSITTQKTQEIQDKENIIDRNYYETDGIFCSFNCCLSFIESNKKEPLYSNSTYLLFKIYNDIFIDQDIPQLTPAPNWRLLKDYGGSMDIEEFRATFSKIEYGIFGRIRELPTFKPLGWVYEEKSNRSN